MDRAEKIRFMSACHDGIDGGHFGRDKTLSMLTIKKNCLFCTDHCFLLVERDG